MTWQGALLTAIARITYRDDPLFTEGLGIGAWIEIDELASIGKYLADGAWSSAKDYVDKAAELRGAA